MKVTFILTCCLVFSATASTYSQNTRLTLNLKNATILDLMQDIESHSKFIFLYQINDLNLNKKVNAEFKDAKIEEILDAVLKGEGLSYEVFEKQILISKEERGVDPSLLTTQQPQKKELSGTVKDSKGLPLPGVTVMVKGTTLGIITDNDGNFRLSVPLDAKILVFSFIGMKTQEFPIASKLNFSIVMGEEAVDMDEFVVVGYGIQKKESVVGAITQVNNQSLMRSGTSNITNAIAGKLSGVLTMQQSGEPGNDDSEVIIRGVSSWNGSAPLTLVDGVERDYRDLDPEEVQTVSVLKDASATAVFGAKGANGVIIVTTKRGSLGKPKMSFTASTGFDKATRIPDFIDSYTTMSMLNAARMNGQQFQNLTPDNILNEYRNPSTPLNALQYPNVDWLSVLSTNAASTYKANFSLQGGTDFVKYFISLGWNHQNDFFDSYHQGYDDTRYRYDRFNYRANIDFSITKSTLLSLNVGGEVGIKNQPNTVPWRNIYQTSPSRFPAYFPAWVLEQVPDRDYPDATGIRRAASFGEYTGNPYSTMNGGAFTRILDSKLFTDVILDQKLDVITKGLSFRGKASLSTYYSSVSLYSAYTFPDYLLNYSLIGVPGANPWSRNGQGNEVYVQPKLAIAPGGLSGYYRDLYYELGFNYSNTFGKHSVSALALLNRQQKNSGSDFPYYNEMLVGRTTYDYSHKYLAEINVSYSGSERFAPSNRFGFFPSAAVGWVVSEEPFFKSAVPWMNKLKFRYSDGLVGSDYASSRWLYTSDYFTQGGNIWEDKGANINAQWEEARKRDVGVEIGLFKNLFSLSVDFFDEYRDNMLLTPNNVTMLVANSFKDLNMGSMKKHGFEVEAEFNKTTRNHLNYFVKGIFGFNENRIIFKDDYNNAPDYAKSAGKPVDAQLNGVELTGTGYYTSVNDIHNNTSPIALDKLNVGDYKFLDYNVDGGIGIADKYPINGSYYPPITYSLSSGFSYKGFDFNFMFQGNKGKYVQFNQIYEAEFAKGDYRVHASQLDYWTPGNQDVNHSTLHYSGSGNADMLSWGGGEADFGYALQVENRFWRNADYLRLKEIYVGYNFNSDLLKRFAGVSNINVYATANNLITFTKLIEGDPESKDFQRGFYPLLSSFNFGLKFNF